jgi:uncharacterized protein YkwD
VKTKQKPKKLVRLNKQIRHHAKMVFVPHKANQYRPHLTRTYGITVVLLLVIGILAGYNLTTTGKVLGTQVSINTDQLLADTNIQRSADKLPPLKINDKLAEAAQLKANDMMKQQYWAHIAPDGTTPWHWFGTVGYNYDYAGENLAKNFTTADAATTAWMASPEHRANILGAHYTDIGFAVVNGVLKGQQTVLVVALFGDQMSQGVVAGTTANNVNAAPSQNISLVTRIGMGIQSLTPAALGSALMLIVVAGVALTAHLYRNKLPKTLRKGWYKHQGLAKVAGMMSLVVVIVALYSGGQI